MEPWSWAVIAKARFGVRRAYTCSQQVCGKVASTSHQREPRWRRSYVLTENANGKFHFNLLASNGRVIAPSEVYNTKAAAMNGIESIRKHAADAGLDDKTK